MSLLKKLNLLGQEINESIYNVNSGGCCVVASEVAAKLAEILGQNNVEVVVQGYDDIGKNNIAEIEAELAAAMSHLTVGSWNDRGVIFAHVLVRFKYEGRAYLFDSDGVVNEGKYYGMDYIHPGSMTIETAAALADDDDPYAWNKSFDRDQIPTLKAIISSLL